MIKANDRFNKRRDLFKVKLYAIRSETKKKEREKLRLTEFTIKYQNLTESV